MTRTGGGYFFAGLVFGKLSALPHMLDINERFTDNKGTAGLAIDGAQGR